MNVTRMSQQHVLMVYILKLEVHLIKSLLSQIANQCDKTFKLHSFEGLQKLYH